MYILLDRGYLKVKVICPPALEVNRLASDSQEEKVADS